MILVIDRVEGNKAVCIDEITKKEHVFNKAILPKWTIEGDILVYENNKFEYSHELTTKRNMEIDDLLNKIFNK